MAEKGIKGIVVYKTNFTMTAETSRGGGGGVTSHPIDENECLYQACEYVCVMCCVCVFVFTSSQTRCPSAYQPAGSPETAHRFAAKPRTKTRLIFLSDDQILLTEMKNMYRKDA